VHYELGSLYLAQSDWNAAIQTFEACLMLAPRNRDDVLANLGFCHFKKGDITQAQLLLKQSLELNPNNSTAKAFMASLPTQQTSPPPTQQITLNTTPATQPITPPTMVRTPPTTLPLSPPSTHVVSLPPPKTTVTPSGPKLEGNYLVEGTNPNGSKYKGAVVIKHTGDNYFVTWNIANQVFNGNGTLTGKTLTVNWKDAKNNIGVVVYAVSTDGSLKGTWGSGKGTEILTPVN